MKSQTKLHTPVLVAVITLVAVAVFSGQVQNRADAAPGDLITPTTMQSFSAEYCATMPIYDPANPDPASTITLTDTRNGGVYEVRKLIDGNCWMVDNLRLGSTAGDTVLTSDDTDLNTASNPNITGGATLSFTLPQVVNSGPNDVYNDPVAYGPVPGDTGAGDTNYGYLYNWSAATAGESRTTMPGDGTNNNIAPNSVCPKGWRMPVGGEYDDVNNEVAQLNARMAGFANNQDATYLLNGGAWYYANWFPTGAFKGVFSGVWDNGYSGGMFYEQGVYYYMWTSLAGVDYAAYGAHVDAGWMSSDYYAERLLGSSVRCLVRASTLGDREPAAPNPPSSPDTPIVPGAPNTGSRR
jgi:uncharacterized protein (TIGR02145 family)